MTAKLPPDDPRMQRIQQQLDDIFAKHATPPEDLIAEDLIAEELAKQTHEKVTQPPSYTFFDEPVQIMTDAQVQELLRRSQQEITSFTLKDELKP